MLDLKGMPKTLPINRRIRYICTKKNTACREACMTIRLKRIIFVPDRKNATIPNYSRYDDKRLRLRCRRHIGE